LWNVWDAPDFGAQNVRFASSKMFVGGRFYCRSQLEVSAWPPVVVFFFVRHQHL
jgi:hypothetical protein